MLWLLGLLGLTGGGIGIAALLGGGPAMLLFGGKALAFAKGLPPKVWYAIAAIALLAGGYLYHQHRLHQHDAALVKATTAADDARWSKALAKAHSDALAWKARSEQQAATIAQDERTKHEEAVRLNAAVADALRLHGPGAASAAHCGQSGYPGSSAAPDRHGQAAPQAGAPAAQVPSGDWALVPWNWLVTVTQEHDDLLDYVTRIEDNDHRQRANWPTAAPQPR